MMEAAERAAEADPLKGGEDGAGGGPGTPAGSELKKKKKTCSDGFGLSKLSHWRTAVFFFSLFLCLTVVFAFSFIIPCPVRPQYLSAWNRSFPRAATYDFLSIEDASKDKVNDIIFVLKDNEGSQNVSCADTGLSSPCVFVSAVDGTDGVTLWERPLAPDFHWAQCGLGGATGRGWDCLLSHADQITAINKHNGAVEWQQPQISALGSAVPVLSLPDLDGDRVGDVALVSGGIEAQTQLVFLSGKTGSQIGLAVTLGSLGRTTKHLLHSTAKGSLYLLLQQDTGLYGLALCKIAAQAKEGAEAVLKKDELWEAKADKVSGLVPVYESNSLRHVLTMERKAGPPNLLLVTEEAVVLVDGNTLDPLWRVGTRAILSEPSFGHFNKDRSLDVVLEEDIGNNTKRVMILDGESGKVLWDLDLLASPNSPRPASIHTINTFSVFMFWGVVPSESNSSSPLVEDRRSYMLHPLYSRVLLESTNVMDHIVAFRATLLERGRHACYILLMGPETDTQQGGVVLSKRKLKQDVPDSRVLRMGAGSGAETNDDIKEAFNRLRFSDD